MYKLVLILRYLKRPIGLFPTLAAALGTYALIVVVAVMTGFGNYVRDNIRGTLSDIVIQADDARGVPGCDELTRALEAVPGVEAVSPLASGKALLTVYDTSDAGQPMVTPVVFIGVDLTRETRVGALSRELDRNAQAFSVESDDETELAGMICGKEIFWPQVAGVHVSLTAPTLSDADVAMAFRVVDFFRSGLADFDRFTVYVPLAAGQELLENPDAATGFHVKVLPGQDVQVVKARLAKVLPPDRFTVKTWAESRTSLLAAIAMERVVWIAVLGSMLVVAGFSILAVLAILVLQKTRDIGILRSIGTSVRGVAAVFLGYGLTLGTLGASIGLLLGYLTIRYIDPIEAFVLRTTGYTPWDRSVFYFDKIPCKVDLVQMFSFFGVAVLISFLASIYPAARAARFDPVRTLRYE